MDIILKQQDTAGISLLQIQLVNGKILQIQEINDDMVMLSNPVTMASGRTSEIIIDGKHNYNCVVVK